MLPNPVSDPDKASTPNFKFRRESDQPTTLNKRLDLDSHNLNNRFSNAHQDSLALRRRQKFEQATFRTYNPGHKKPFLLALLVVGLGLLFFILTQTVGSSSESPFFCDTNDHYAQDCTPCPRFAHCEKGQLKYCDAGYIKQDDECILNAKIDLLANKMLKFLKKELAAGNGELLCKQQEKKAQIRVDEIAQIVSKNFKKNANFDEALLLLLTKMDVPEEHGL